MDSKRLELKRNEQKCLFHEKILSFNQGEVRQAQSELSASPWFLGGTGS